MASGAGPTLGALKAKGFSSDYGWNEMSRMSGIGIGDPCHCLLVGAHVRSHHIDLRSDKRNHLHGEAAGHPFEFTSGHFHRLAADAALPAAEGEAEEGAFPVHPHCEGRDFADIDFRMIAQATLHRPAGKMMLNTVSEKHLGAAVIAPDRDGNGDDTLWPFAAFTYFGI